MRTSLSACAALVLLIAATPARAQTRSEISVPEPEPPPESEAIAAGTAAMPVEAAQIALAAAAREHGRESLEILEPLLDLAEAEAGAGDYTAAVEKYAEAVRLVETLRGAMDRRLIEPLRGLGASANAAGDYLRAAEALERALHVNRIQHGLFDLSQVDLLEALSRSYVGMGRERDAEFRRRSALRLAIREYGADSLRTLPALASLAGWYHSQYRYPAERALLEREIELIGEHRGENDPSLVAPLRALALSYRLEFNSQREGERALERALEIHESHPGDTVALARTLAALGDWRLIFRKRHRAFQTYGEAFRLLAADASAAGSLDEIFGAPVPLYFLRPRQPEIGEDAAPGDLAQGFVLVEFSVNDIGRVDDVRLIESQPADLMDSRVMRALREARYRPRIVNGEPVPTAGLRLRHTFVFDRRNLDVADESAADR